MGPGGPPDAYAAAGCQRCRYVSYSPHHEDCSWFHACDYTKLQSEVNGFRSGRVEPSMIDFSRAVKAARQTSLLKTLIALDSERGVARVVRNCRRDERGRRVLVTIAANSRDGARAARPRRAHERRRADGAAARARH